MNAAGKPWFELEVTARRAPALHEHGIALKQDFHPSAARGNMPSPTDSQIQPNPSNIKKSASVSPELQKTKGAMTPERAALLAAVVNSARDAIIAMSPSGAIVSWNEGAEHLYGYTPEEAVGRSFSSLVPLNRLDEFLKLLDSAHHGEILPVLETVHLRKGGGHVEVVLAMSPMPNSAGVITGISAIVREVGGPNLREQELRRTNEKLVETVNFLRQRNAEMNLVQELSERLESCCCSGEVHPVLEKLIPKLFPTGSGTLFELNTDLKLLEAGMCWGSESSKNVLFLTEECWAMRRGQPHEVVGSDAALRCSHLVQLTHANSICAPLIVSGETLGMLCVLSSPYELSQPKEVQERLSTARLRLVEMVSRHIALTLANLKLRERLQAQSIRDPVTGLFNRRYLDETLAREVHRAARDNKCFSIIICDIDRFKQFNDANGHAAGDSLLHSFGSLVQKTVRAGDIACRYGGDEFVLLLLETPLETAKKRAELLQREFQRLTVPIGERFLNPGTLTLGVSSYPLHGLTSSALLAVADRALYRGKSQGGNRSNIGEATV